MPATSGATATSTELRISEIFYSLQGETKTVGLPTVFVRLVGCPLRCVYCDTEYAFQGGSLMSLEDIRTQVATYDPQYVTVTGGEPLAQIACRPLLSLLCDQGYSVSLETSGALPINDIDERVQIVMDLKTPGSQELEKNRYENIDYLRPSDQVKFVILDRQDYDWSCDLIDRYKLTDKCEVLFSPVYGKQDPKELAEWILKDRRRVRLQLQLHKLLWGETPGH